MPANLIVFDCDSTLSAIEGVDELARLRGEDVFKAVKAFTDRAMNGEIAINEVFGRRLEVIQPTRAMCEAIGQLYLETIEPTALATIQALQAAGWAVAILSGGFAPAIEPLAAHLGIARIEAVPLYFDTDGTYAGFGEDYPTTRNGGKPEVIQRLRAELAPEKIVMVGDGVSDLETGPVVDLFVGYGGYAARPAVQKGAAHFITHLDELLEILPVKR
ncbi:MAG: HAD-IB family phosphatase [Chthoniobacteraceae bacterium]